MDTKPPSSPRPDRPRVFGIGLNKTGTVSLNDALTILGFKGVHDGGPEVHDAVKAAIDAEVPLLSYLDNSFDAFSDIGLLSRRFRLLDAQYPGSRFVLTVRPFDEWIDSRRRHIARNVALKAIGEYDSTFLVVDEAKWTREWEHHIERVHAYFGSRRDFLETDITRQPSWGPLCELLEMSEPGVPFPWSNRDPVLHGEARRARWAGPRRLGTSIRGRALKRWRPPPPLQETPVG